MYEMACFLCFPLLCAETGTHSAFIGVDVLGTERGCSLEACLKNFTYFLRVACALRLESGPYFLEPLVSGSHLPLCVATVHGCPWTNFVYFLREKWTRISLQFTLGNLELFLRAVSGSLRRASVYGAFGRISLIFNVLVVPVPCAVRT